MKDKFIEYHIDEHLEKIFNDATIVLDTNSLLNLYRYSKDTRSKYLEILIKVEKRLFLTYHVGSEFYKKRYTLVANRSEFKSLFNELLENYYGKLLNIIKNSTGESKFNPTLSILKHEDELRDNIISEIEQSTQNVKKYIDEFDEDIDIQYIQGKDPILAKVVKIFKDKISPEISKQDLEAIFKEGELRYKKEIPPGYKDNDKPIPEKYGDLIIWEELKNLAKTSKQDILFVSDDRKEDWAISFKGMNLGPRKELIREFHDITGKLFYSITTKEFIKKISEIYTVKDTESLEKETEIIQKKFQEEWINSIPRWIDDWKKERALANTSIRNSIEDWSKQQEIFRNSTPNPLEDWNRQQEIIRNALQNPIEDIGRQEEIIRNILRNPDRDRDSKEEIIRDILRNPYRDRDRKEEIIRDILRNSNRDWDRPEELLRKSLPNQTEERSTQQETRDQDKKED
jgi:hypothetical protein